MTKRLCCSKLISNSETILLLRGGLVALLLRTSAAILSFLLVLMITNVVGINRSGDYFLGVAIVSVLAVVSRFGLDQYLVREIAYESKIQNRVRITFISSSAIVMVFLASLLFSVTFFLFSGSIAIHFFRDVELTSFLEMLSFSIMPFALYSLYGQMFQGAGQQFFFQLTRGLGQSSIMLLLACIFFLACTKLSVFDLGICYILSSIIFFISVAYRWHRIHGLAICIFRKSNIAFRALVPLFLLSVLALADQWYSILALGMFSSPQDVAIFTVSMRLGALLSLVLVAINSVVAPKLSVLFRNSMYVELKRMIIISTRFVWIIGIPLALFILFFPDYLLDMFGRSFSQGTQILQMVIVGQVINILFGPVGWLLIAMGKERIYLYITFFSVLTLVISLFYFVPAMGALGAAIAQVISVSFSMVAATIYIYKELGFAPVNVFTDISH